ncbi:glutaredoxin [Marasmius fiardii PR-910]|nr:glutaredoxin [Marasmius fiardii PR-910]
MAAKDLAESTISENTIAFFSKSWCPYCKAAKALFKEKYPDEKIKIVELDEINEGDEIQNYLAQKTNQRSVPNIFINQKHVGGNDKVQALQKEGKLVKLINEKAKVGSGGTVT